MSNKYLLAVVAGLYALTSDAQVLGGQFAHAWLSAAPTAQTTGLAGWQLRLDGRDPGLVNFNPATLNANTDRVVHLSQEFYAGEINRSALAAGLHVDRWDIDAGLTVRYVDYGDFEGRDFRGERTADFNARDYAIGGAFAKTLNERVRVGAQLQLIGGSLEQYNSLGAAVSAGLTYTPDSAQRTVWGVQAQHAGYLWNQLTEQNDPLPFELSVGVSRRLAYLPLRFGILYRRLDRWDLLYDDPDRRESTVLIGDDDAERGAASEFLDNLARHFAFNAELYLGKKEVVQLRVGYDHQRQRELRLAEARSLAGFSFGFGLNLRRVRIDYGRGIQHLGGGTNHLGLLVDFGSKA